MECCASLSLSRIGGLKRSCKLSTGGGGQSCLTDLKYTNLIHQFRFHSMKINSADVKIFVKKYTKMVGYLASKRGLRWLAPSPTTIISVTWGMASAGRNSGRLVILK
jgi:hypothetical protein